MLNKDGIVAKEEIVWLPFNGCIESEDEAGIILSTIPPEKKVRLRFKRGDYKIEDGQRVKIRKCAKFEWMDPPPTCNVRR